MKKSNIKKLSNRIELTCCNHRKNRNKYLLGYAGLKCCKVAMCLDCDKVQFIGGWFGKALYSAIKKITRNRIEVIETIDSEPIFDERWYEELEKYGREKQ